MATTWIILVCVVVYFLWKSLVFCPLCLVTDEELPEHSDADTEDSEFVPDSDNSDDDDGENNDSNHSDDDDDNDDDDDDMENLLFELSDMSNF